MREPAKGSLVFFPFKKNWAFMSESSRKWTLAAALGAGTLAFGLYLLTAAPTITWSNDGADGGDLIVAVATFGVPHPPGYPTYLLLGWLSSILLPFGDPAYRLILLSAVSGAVAVGLITVVAAVFVRPSTARNGFALLLAGLALGAAPLFWSQATIVEVYSPAAAGFAAVLLLIVLRLQRKTGGRALLPWAGLLLGIGTGLHFQLLFLGAAAIPALRLAKVPWREMLMAALAFLLGTLVFLLLPLIASQHPPIAWGDPTDLSGFFWTVSGTPYRSIVFGVPLDEVPQRALGTVGLLVRQFGPMGWLLAAWGVYRLWGYGGSRPFLLLVGVLGALSIVYTLGYNSRDFVVYLIPVLLVVAVLIAAGTAFLLELLSAWRAWTPLIGATVLLLALPVLSLGLNYSSLDLTSDTEALDYAIAAVETSGGRPSIILADSDEYVFSLWYHQYVYAPQDAPEVIAVTLLQYRWYRDQVRRNIAVDLLPPEPVTYQGAYEALLAHVMERPIYLTWDGSQTIVPHRLQPVGPLYRVLPQETDG